MKNITNPPSTTITQPLTNNSGNLEWEDQNILDILVDKHIRRSDISHRYSFDEDLFNEINSFTTNLLSSEGPNPEIFYHPISTQEKIFKI